MPKIIVAFICLFFLCATVHAQRGVVKGRISDSTDKKSLDNAVVSLLKRSDTTLVSFRRVNAKGQFEFPSIDTGHYVILISFPKFADYMESVDVTGDLNLGDINMTPKSKLLDEVIIRTANAIRIKGDTTEFVADSFKVKEGATVEDLLKKLPGFTVNAKGEIVAQGKRVDKVLVDGEEFFGDDPTMATQNISAKAVDRVQVFETKSEQQQITGITTGNEGKTVNIKLKEDAKKGAFGKIHVGTDFDHFIDSKAFVNKFKGKQKFSVYGTRTNTNAGSLNWEDRQKLGIENDFEFDEISGFYFSFGGGDEFNDWNLRGLPDAYTAGALFADKWNSDKHNLNLSYRFNRLGTVNNGTTLTQNVLPSGLTYSNRYSNKDALNQQHAFTFKHEWKIDSLASVKIVSTNTFKNSRTIGNDITEFMDSDLDTINKSSRTYDNSTKRSQTDNQFTYKQLFNKKNRLWQTVVRYGVIDDDNNGFTNTHVRYFQNGFYDYTDTIDQQKTFVGSSTTLGLKSIFSEPLSLKWMLVLDYSYNKNHSISKRNTFEKGFNEKYEVLVNDFSNNFELDAFSHTGNAILRYVSTKMRLAVGSGISTVKLNLDNLDDLTSNEYNFLNFTPQAQINFMPKQQTNFGINYRGTTRQPTINQLQPLRDNSDPLNEYIGNPDLEVGFNHNFSINFNEYKVLKQLYSYFFFSYSFQENAITQFNTIDAQGKRSYFPVNVNGNRNWNMGGNIHKQGGEKKPNLGLNVQGNGARYISFINGERATTKSASFTLNPSIGLEKKKYMINLGPTLGHHSSNSSLASSVDNNYFTYGGRFDATVKLPGKFEITTNINADLRQKIRAFTSNTNLVIWNAEISKKLFKKDVCKLSIIANDILDENKGFTRTINNTFITDDRFQRVSRYFLLRFEWSFTKSPGGEAK